MTTIPPTPPASDDRSGDAAADDRIDRIARDAGRELRRPAPEQGFASVQRGRRNRQITRAIAGSSAAIAILVGGFLLVNNRADDDTVSTSDTAVTVPEPEITSASETTPAPEPTAVPVTTQASPLPPTLVPVTTQAPDITAVPTSVPPSSAPPTEVSGLLAIPNRCDESTAACTRLANTEDGRIVALDPLDDTLRIYDSLGSQLLDEVTVDEPIAGELAELVFVGPDDVAYILFDTPGLDDPGNDLVAVPLSGPSAGSTIQRWSGLDGSGDSGIVPRSTGLAVVNCCGFKVVRPESDAVFYPFVDSSGAATETQTPTFEIALGESGNELWRTDNDGTRTTFPLPTVFQYPRDMPVIVGTDDGGALATDYVDGFGLPMTVFVRFRTGWEADGFDNTDVYLIEGFRPGRTLLEASGTVVVSEGDTFVRRDLDEIATPGWEWDVTYDLRGGGVSIPGLNEAIDELQPFWALQPELLALQIVPVLSPGASVQIDFDAVTELITISTSGITYDGISTERVFVQTERVADDLIHVTDASFAWQCQPGSGHQDFSLEPCN